MATRLWFPILRKTKKDDANGERVRVGYFSCVEHVANFLEIEKKAETGVLTIEREYNPNRANTRVDSSKIKANASGAPKKATKVQVILRRTVGRKRIIIQTRKEITDSKSKHKEKLKPTHQISLAFPTWATAITISDALAEIIPENKISRDPDKKDTIPPSFRLVGGGSYGIISKAEAEKRTGATTSADQIEQQLQQEGGDVIDGQD